MPRPIIALPLSLFWLACLFAAPAGAQEDCQAVSFAPGQSTLELSGTAPPDDVVCFSLTGLSGESVSVAVSQGANVMFSIDGLIDASDRHRFTAAQDRYRILVGQLMRSIDAEPFRLRISLEAPLPPQTQPRESAPPVTWTAASGTAMAITGDLTVSGDELIFTAQRLRRQELCDILLPAVITAWPVSAAVSPSRSRGSQARWPQKVCLQSLRASQRRSAA